MLLPLQGLKVLDLTRLLPGPFASMILAELGADVVRVETPDMVDYLRYEPRLFAHLNRNKRSLSIRYDRPEGARILQHMAGQCDVFMESNRPGVLARFGLDSASLCATHPRLIYLSLTGYGQQGELAHRAGHDINYLARSGLADCLGPHDKGTVLADFSGGMMGAMAALAAVCQRHQSGLGGPLDVSLTDGPVALTTWALVSQMWPNLAGASPVYRNYRCADGRYLSLGALEKKFQDRLLSALDLDAQGRDLFLNPDPAWQKKLEDLFASQPLAYWTERLGRADGCAEPVLTPAEVVADEWLGQRRLLQGLLAPSFGAPPQEPAPEPGQHNRQVLAAAGFTEAEIDDWTAQGLLG